MLKFGSHLLAEYNIKLLPCYLYCPRIFLGISIQIFRKYPLTFVSHIFLELKQTIANIRQFSPVFRQRSSTVKSHPQHCQSTRQTDVAEKQLRVTWILLNKSQANYINHFSSTRINRGRKIMLNTTTCDNNKPMPGTSSYRCKLKTLRYGKITPSICCS